MNKNNAIEVRNMSKKFKIEYDKATTLKERLIFWNKHDVEYHEVLKNINLNIKKGETVALIGVNGSGKSTLLKLMTRIIFPNEGTIEVDGKLTSLLELGAGFHPDLQEEKTFILMQLFLDCHVKKLIIVSKKSLIFQSWENLLIIPFVRILLVCICG